MVRLFITNADASIVSLFSCSTQQQVLSAAGCLTAVFVLAGATTEALDKATMPNAKSATSDPRCAILI
jgi:hypothetical protein